MYSNFISTKAVLSISLKKSYAIGRENFEFSMVLGGVAYGNKCHRGTLGLGWLITYPFTVLCFWIATLKLMEINKYPDHLTDLFFNFNNILCPSYKNNTIRKVLPAPAIHSRVIWRFFLKAFKKFMDDHKKNRQ